MIAADLTDRRNDHEDELLRRLKRLIPKGMRVHVLADRGFGDVKLYELLAHELGFALTIRFRGCITVESADGTTKTAAEWVPPNGVAKILKGAKITAAKVEVGAVVLVKKKGMKEPWILATSEGDGGAAAASLYSRRFTTEENFRDEKDPRYGIGVLNVRLASPERRDRLIQIVSIANVLLTLLGAAGESLGLDRQLRANTVRRRTHSLFRQGRKYLHKAVGKLADGGRALGEAFLSAVKHCKEAHEIFGDI